MVWWINTLPWWINTMVWWINTRFALINTRVGWNNTRFLTYETLRFEEAHALNHRSNPSRARAPSFEVHSAEINMIDWQRRLFRHFCHVTMDLDPSTQDLVVEPYEGMYDELDQAIHEHHASILIVETMRAYRARKRAATMMQAIVRGFLRRPVDLTGEC